MSVDQLKIGVLADDGFDRMSVTQLCGLCKLHLKTARVAGPHKMVDYQSDCTVLLMAHQRADCHTFIFHFEYIFIILTLAVSKFNFHLRELRFVTYTA